MSEKNNETKIMMTDEEIVDLYWNREEKAIHETDKKYGRYLYKIAYNIVHDQLDCEECLNDTYLGTWNRIPPTRPHQFQVFISKIMRNIAINRFKSNHASKRIPSEFTVSLDELDACLPASLSLQDEITLQEIARILNDYLEGLSRKEQLLFVCRYYYSDRVSEIARMLETNDRAIYRALSSIREGLKAKLEKEGYQI